jgi:hypothetical protein
LRRWVWATPMRQSAITPPAMRTLLRHTVWLILSEPASARSYLEELNRRSREIAATARAARELFASFDLATMRVAQMASIGQGNCTGPPISSAIRPRCWRRCRRQVEGQVHRLKLVKRQMYGRASFDLLRLRVLNTA